MADPTFEEPVCFVATDPSYCVALDAIDELRRGGRLEREDDMPVKVGNSGLRHSRDVEEGGSKKKEITIKYNRLYDFSRTLGAVLRAFMLKATRLIKYYNPEIDSETAKLNLKPGTESGFYVEVNGETKTNTPQFMTSTPKKADAGKRSQAQLISGNFDRLYPHILIEKKLKDAAAGLDKEVSFPGRMLIVDMDLKNPDDPRVIKIHTINTTVRFTEKEDKVIDCPHPSVEYTYERVLPGKDGTKFKLLKDMIKGYPEIVKRWESYDPQEADPGAVQPGEQAAPDAAQPGEKAAPGAAQPGEKAAPGAAQPGEQAAPGAAQPGEKAAPGAAQPGEQAAPGAAQPGEKAAPGAAQPGEQAAPGAAQPGGKAAPGAGQPGGQADPGAAKPGDEKEEEEEVAQKLKDVLHVKT
ncbi:hypothetical protein Bbelb_029320 [Branchiostoma belcheri]|nr:hypothetical protein Bbelb_029320 [Branchiostoma belcheri]